MPNHLPLLPLLCLPFLAAQAAIAAPADRACALREAPVADFALQVPFDIVDGRIYVQARVNGGGPFRFAIDTGASGMARADRTLVAALGLVASGKASTSDGVQTAAVDTVHLDSLGLGGLERKAGAVITRDYSSRLSAGAGFHGILARDFFADGLLVLDYPRKTLSFSRTLSLPLTETVVSYQRAFRIPVSVNGVAAEANLDTGANVSLVMPLALYERVGQAPLEAAGAATLTNTRIETRRTRVPGPVDIGAVRLSDLEARVSDRFPELLVGSHVLQKFAVLIDQRSKRIALCETP
jgi:predicted aspartyl protease